MGKKQCELLMENKVGVVIRNGSRLKSTKEEAKKLIEYYQANIDRVNYKDYQKTGCGIIGSGAIESAHRKVIQKRMKQFLKHPCGNRSNIYKCYL